MSFAMLFPGQGSQSVGMLGALASDAPQVRATFDEASAVLGLDLWQLTAQGPAEALNATENTQPAMLAAGIAIWRVWRDRGGPAPGIVAGHSLGEFTALVCAGALDFRAAIALVRFRGQLMQQAVPAGAGAMAAVLGLADHDVELLCADAGQGEVVEAVNYNSPNQVVIAGQSAAVARAVALAKSRGAKRAVLLPVSVPAHSSLMRDAAQKLRQRLADTVFEQPKIRYISAVDALVHESPEDIRSTLVRQLASPVRWSRTVQAIDAMDVWALVECGPGRVLAGLNKRIEHARPMQCSYMEDSASIDATLIALRGGPAHD